MTKLPVEQSHIEIKADDIRKAMMFFAIMASTDTKKQLALSRLEELRPEIFTLLDMVIGE